MMAHGEKVALILKKKEDDLKIADAELLGQLRLWQKRANDALDRLKMVKVNIREAINQLARQWISEADGLKDVNVGRVGMTSYDLAFNAAIDIHDTFSFRVGYDDEYMVNLKERKFNVVGKVTASTSTVTKCATAMNLSWSDARRVFFFLNAVQSVTGLNMETIISLPWLFGIDLERCKKEVSPPAELDVFRHVSTNWILHIHGCARLAKTSRPNEYRVVRPCLRPEMGWAENHLMEYIWTIDPPIRASDMHDMRTKKCPEGFCGPVTVTNVCQTKYGTEVTVTFAQQPLSDEPVQLDKYVAEQSQRESELLAVRSSVIEMAYLDERDMRKEGNEVSHAHSQVHGKMLKCVADRQRIMDSAAEVAEWLGYLKEHSQEFSPALLKFLSCLTSMDVTDEEDLARQRRKNSFHCFDIPKDLSEQDADFQWWHVDETAGTAFLKCGMRFVNVVCDETIRFDKRYVEFWINSDNNEQKQFKLNRFDRQKFEVIAQSLRPHFDGLDAADIMTMVRTVAQRAAACSGVIDPETIFWYPPVVTNVVDNVIQTRNLRLTTRSLCNLMTFTGRGWLSQPLLKWTDEELDQDEFIFPVEWSPFYWSLEFVDLGGDAFEAHLRRKAVGDYQIDDKKIAHWQVDHPNEPFLTLVDDWNQVSIVPENVTVMACVWNGAAELKLTMKIPAGFTVSFA